MILQGYDSGRLLLQGLYAGPLAFVPDLIVETGVGVNGANSYVDVETARQYARARKKAALFADFEATESYLILACDYLQSLTYEGRQTTESQPLAWPRTKAYFDCKALGVHVIPGVLKQAQIEIALNIANGLDVMPVTSGQLILSEKIGSISTTYSEGVGFGSVEMPFVEALLSQLTGPGFSGGLTTIRV